MSALSDLVDSFLPMDPDQVESLFDDHEQIDLVSVLLASFTVSAQALTTNLSDGERHNFCRRAAEESEGLVKPWQVEAGLRSAEGDQSALTGIDSLMLSRLQTCALLLISADFLTAEECKALRPQALNLAEQYRSELAAL